MSHDDKKVELVPLEDVDEGEVLALLNTALGAGPTGRRDTAYWRWKHHDSPFGPSPGMAALAGGRPVALRMFLRWRWQRSDGRELAAVRAVDTATHPDWRRRGLFRRLTLAMLERLRDDGTRLIFNTPNRHSRPGYLAMGWRDLGAVPVRVRPVAAWRRRNRFADLPPVVDFLARPTPADRLCAAAAEGAGGRLHTAPTADYLAWRYTGVPGLDYRALWEEGDGAGDGFAAAIVRRRRRRGLIEGTVCELWAGGADGLTRGRRLLRRLADLSDIHYLAAVTPAASTAERCFRGLPLPGPRLTVRPLTGDGDLDLTAWDLSIGDLELF